MRTTLTLLTVLWLMLFTLVDEPRLIPLKDILSDRMPQTRDVYLLEPTDVSQDASLVIKKALTGRPPLGGKAGPAFVVPGIEMAALEQARDILTRKKTAPTTVSADDPVTLVFYSRDCGRYVRINAVLNEPSKFTVKFQVVGHATLEVTNHFALIPLGKLPPGKYQVDMQLVGNTDDFNTRIPPIADPFRYVSGPFSFEVK